MNGRHADAYLASLVREFCKYPTETEWVEFKRNNAEPQRIGENISALANSAVLEGKQFAYIVWGVRDSDHAIIGTRFDPQTARIGQEELESWLLRLLEPKLDFRFVKLVMDDRPLVVLEIAGIARHPVRFSGKEFVRVGSLARFRTRGRWRGVPCRGYWMTRTDLRLSRRNPASDRASKVAPRLVISQPPASQCRISRSSASAARMAPCSTRGGKRSKSKYAAKSRRSSTSSLAIRSTATPSSKGVRSKARHRALSFSGKFRSGFVATRSASTV